jgi:CheY-like chemotaxis protein
MDVTPLSEPAEVLPSLESALREEKAFDVGILSIRPSDQSAYRTARQLRDNDLQIPYLPLLALSATQEKISKRCSKAGFDGFLTKPVRRWKLYEMLGRLMGETKTSAGVAQRSEIITKHSLREEAKHSTRILLAEDNPVNQKLALTMLRKAGYQVEVARNGRQVINKYRESPGAFDLIFMDMQMPEMDGIEATKAIRSHEKVRLGEGPVPRPSPIPIVAMTANAMKGSRDECLQAGMDDYVTKPIKRELVFEIIEKWVLKRKAYES